MWLAYTTTSLTMVDLMRYGNRYLMSDLPADDVIRLAKLVLNLNAFCCEEEFFLQVHGTAMGTSMAPSYANIFMGRLEEQTLSTALGSRVPTFYKRFIDHFFGIWLQGEESLLAFIEHTNTVHEDIKLTHQFGHQATLLDVALTIAGDSISTDLHTKQIDTSTHQYLLPSSDHPPHAHRGLPYGLGIRIKTIVSGEVLERSLEELATILAARNYPRRLIDRPLDRVRAKL